MKANLAFPLGIHPSPLPPSFPVIHTHPHAPPCSPADCNLLSELYNRGNEIADHTVTHTSLLGLDAAGLEREILGARSELAACGIPEEDVVGLRAPYLETKTEVRQLLHENGFLYERCAGPLQLVDGRGVHVKEAVC